MDEEEGRDHTFTVILSPPDRVWFKDLPSEREWREDGWGRVGSHSGHQELCLEFGWVERGVRRGGVGLGGRGDYPCCHCRGIAQT